MTFGDFDRLGLVPNLPPRAELPIALRLAIEQTSLLPVDVVIWVATAPADAVQAQMRQALMVRFESEDEKEAEQAGQLARLCQRRLDHKKTSVPVVGPSKQLRLSLD